MRLATKLSGMAIGGTCIILLMGVTTYISVAELIKSNDMVSHSREVVQELNMLLYNLADAISTQRVYLITNQEIYLDAYHAGVVSTNQNIEKLTKLVSDDPQQTFRLSNLNTLIKERIASLDNTISLYKTKGLEAAFNKIRTGRSLHFRMALHKSIDEIKQYELNLLQAREEEMHRSAQTSQLTILAGTCLGLAIVILFSYLFAKYILNCIGQLIKTADNIRYGRFDLYTPVNSNDEFAELARAFNTVGQELLVISKRIAEQQEEIASTTHFLEESNAEVQELHAVLANKSHLSNNLEKLLAEQILLTQKLSVAFSHVDDTTHKLETVCSDQKKLSVSDLANVKSYLTHIQDTEKIFDSLIANLDLLSIAIDFEQAREKTSDESNKILLERLKDLIKEAKQDKSMFIKLASHANSAIEELLHNYNSLIDTITTLRQSIELMRNEKSSVNKIDDNISKMNSLLESNIHDQ